MKNMREDFLYPIESYAIIAAAKDVWKELGGSFKEKIAEKIVHYCFSKERIKN